MNRLARWRPGESITARKLNAPIDEINQAVNIPADRSEGLLPTEGSTSDAVEDPADETYTVISSSTETVRIEDPDDADTYVDVQRVTTVVFSEVETGKTLKLILEGLY